MFENKQSVCRGYFIEYYCPIVLELNPSKVNLKLIASRVSRILHASSFNTTHSTNNTNNNNINSSSNYLILHSNYWPK